MSSLAYSEHDEALRALGLGPARFLHQVTPVEGAVVGGPERFVRRDEEERGEDREPLAASASTARLAHWSGLTARDVMVLGFLAQGWTTAEIAHHLAYAESTIKKEVHLIVHRLGARNRTHAVALAVRRAVV